MRRALVLCACALVAGCGGGDAAEPELDPAPAGVSREVRTMFRAYSEALSRGDFPAACTHLTEASIAQLAAQVDEVAPGAKDCPGLLGRLYGPAGSKARRELDGLVRTLEVHGVDATARRDTVLLSWSAEVGGRRVAIKQPVLQVGGRWQLVAAPSAAGAGQPAASETP